MAFLSLCWEILMSCLSCAFITHEDGDVRFDLERTEGMIFFTYFRHKRENSTIYILLFKNKQNING